MDWDARQELLKNRLKLIGVVVLVVVCVITVMVRHSQKQAELRKKINEQFVWCQERIRTKPELKGLTAVLVDPDDGPIRVEGVTGDEKKIMKIKELLDYPVTYACDTLIVVD